MFEIIKILHIVGASVLFGTGMGIAYFMLMAHRSGNIPVLAQTASHVVFADIIFTAVAVVVQPLTGVALVHLRGYAFSETWIWMSLALYVFIGFCWLPVVWLQMQMKHMATSAAERGAALDPAYFRYFKIWFALGWPAFISVLAIIGLMVIRPM
jgi:uncharacterized membrane protein